VGARSASARRRRALARAGAEVLVLPGRGGLVRIAAVLRALAARGVVSVLVEGGGDLAAQALRERVVDRLLVVSAPIVVGGDGRPMVAALGVRRLAGAPRLRDERTRRLGADVVREGAVQY